MSHTNKTVEDMERALIKGYIEMSAINLEEAESSVCACNDALRVSEERLTECE